jgi:DNA-binding transcriptional MerR regulator
VIVGQEHHLRIGELATLSGLTPDAVRYDERLGLMPRARRTAGGYRMFAPGATERIRFIKQAQANGLSLAEIRQLLAFQDRGGREQCRHVHRLLGVKLAELDTKLAQLEEFRKTLRDYLAQCERSLGGSADAECPVVERLERSDRTGRRSDDADQEQEHD